MTLATRLIDEGHDPALRELARERLIDMLEYEDWNENQVPDDDIATHVQPPLLADRPWALGVARNVLARVRCPSSRAVVMGALRARFGVEVEPDVGWAGTDHRAPSIRHTCAVSRSDRALPSRHVSTRCSTRSRTPRNARK